MARGGSGVNTGGNPGKGKAAPRRARPCLVNPADPSAGPARQQSGGGRRAEGLRPGGAFSADSSFLSRKQGASGAPPGPPFPAALGVLTELTPFFSFSCLLLRGKDW